ncbi:hypothetical protein HYP99_gp090 [Sinorhizobium phage ort11]|uniref:Uncharacterized protein n=1 Tax=Sinorhizobium phage ort11 TaxID=2599764 RepID=A0A5C2H1F2_9CAUD|nr:hypothetical protein HYP99_gp090 [Sinorhizobium phage ort11]QEP29888.1 hypothetical protein Smphiort11_090 [Sinorhizobium phage ort11]
MYEYVAYTRRGKVFAEGKCMFGDLPKVLDHYGEQGFTISVKKSS